MSVNAIASLNPSLFNFEINNNNNNNITTTFLFQKHKHFRPFRRFTVPPLPPSSVLRCSSFLSDMESPAGRGIYPLHRTKTIHLVRHAQGVHNVEGEKNHDAYMSEELFDAHVTPLGWQQVRHAQGVHNVEGEKNHDAYMSEELFDAHVTPLGWQQVDNLRKHVQASGLSKRIELVIVSPLLRTMQTAVGAFGGEGYTDGIDVPPLMVAKAGNSGRPSISSLNSPPFIAVEQCREHLGVHPCDRRRSISEYKPLFPAIDFSLIENEGDILWKADVREKDEDIAARGVKFMNWLFTRKEKEIAVVTHSGFLFNTLGAYGNDCHPSMKNELSRHFNNCELRSVVIVDTSNVGSDTSKTDYPGKIPSGADVPSDAAD